jgi:Ni/Fe-hydrogenase 1 B-type cytochrome subunit
MATTSDAHKNPAGARFSDTHAPVEPENPASRVYVYEAPVRIWHWFNAACIVVMAITGYLIGQPLPSTGGEASIHFMFGDIRMIHFAAGQLLIVALLGRFVWVFLGNKYANHMFMPPLWSRKWWGEVWGEVRWYAFLEKTPKDYLGLNPLAQLAIFALFLLPLLNLVATGGALYGEGAGVESYWYKAFSWVFSVYGNSFNVHTVHRLSMWVIVCFSIMHIYLAIREDIFSGQSAVSTMISGWRYFRKGGE